MESTECKVVVCQHEFFFQSVPVCQLKTGRKHQEQKDTGWNNYQGGDPCFDNYGEHMKSEELAIFLLYQIKLIGYAEDLLKSLL